MTKFLAVGYIAVGQLEYLRDATSPLSKFCALAGLLFAAYITICCDVKVRQ